MDELHKKRFEGIVSLYLKAKDAHIKGEEVDKKFKSNIQPLNEYRSALDHLIRVAMIDNDLVGCDGNLDDELNKLEGHLKRAFYDIADLLCLNLRNKILKSIERYGANVIKDVIPEYYSEIKPKLVEISDKIASLRKQKGIENDKNLEKIKEYEEIIKTLYDYYHYLIKNEDKAILKRLKWYRLKANLPGYIIGFLGIILSIIFFFINR